MKSQQYIITVRILLWPVQGREGDLSYSKIQAIKHARGVLSTGLKEAKDFVEATMEGPLRVQVTAEQLGHFVGLYHIQGQHKAGFSLDISHVEGTPPQPSFNFATR